MRKDELDQNYSFYKGNKRRRQSGDHTYAKGDGYAFTALTFLK